MPKYNKDYYEEKIKERFGIKGLSFVWECIDENRLSRAKISVIKDGGIVRKGEVHDILKAKRLQQKSVIILSEQEKIKEIKDGLAKKGLSLYPLDAKINSKDKFCYTDGKTINSTNYSNQKRNGFAFRISGDFKERFLNHCDCNEILILSDVNNMQINQKTKIKLKCKKCGYVWQTTAGPVVYQESGCAKCKRKVKYTASDFIIRAREVHGDKYDYSKVEYVNINTKVCIICPTHGEFWQTPSNHLNGSGCRKCANKDVTTKEWVKKAKLIHGNRYDYSKVEYINCETNVCIVCHKHGEFWQKPSGHLSGQGCPHCNGGKEIKFFTFEKIGILSQYDLLNLDWACILDLVSEDKLPKEFSQLATFAAGSKGRKKLIDELSKKYSIPESGEDADNEEEETSAEQATNDTKIATDDEIISATIPLPSEQTKHATTGGIMHEIDTIASIIQRGDKTTYSSGDKMKHIVAKELSKLWSQVLRDDENHNTNTINEINDKLK